MQGTIFAYKKFEYSKHMKIKTTNRTLGTKVWKEKDNFTPKNIFMYSPQMDLVSIRQSRQKK
jgi:hypothetical protein